ncbi:hypothetical protein [Clostridium estertheticum]|uniref:hypothetical protein n=1 Tax=Clostridium estertheticum TaxID=238834 RepID=UPI001FADCFD6|nr:hypothetical protein [Clostridium estertheticum]WBL48464.1 hypothetical protein LOR37_07355 [Clostridium estertheticum]
MLKDIELPDNDTRDIAKALNNKGIIEIIELKGGLSISTNSYVGRISHHLRCCNINDFKRRFRFYLKF